MDKIAIVYDEGACGYNITNIPAGAEIIQGSAGTLWFRGSRIVYQRSDSVRSREALTQCFDRLRAGEIDEEGIEKLVKTLMKTRAPAFTGRGS